MTDFGDALLRMSDQVNDNNLRATAAKERAASEATKGIVAEATATIMNLTRPIEDVHDEPLHRHHYQAYANPQVNPGCVRCPHAEAHPIHLDPPPTAEWVPKMRGFVPGVVFTVGPGREENVSLALNYLLAGQSVPEAVVIILDGPEVRDPVLPAGTDVPVQIVRIPRHEPGHEQPRNVGVRHLPASCTYAWFLDSDVLVEGGTLRAYEVAHAAVGDAILIGPYEWMPEGVRVPSPEIHTDFRWPMFNERGMTPAVAELGVALGCFGGNLAWPRHEFERIGGFHQQLYHGRCEDGELGLRAASHRIPMALVAHARGYHVAHPVNHALAEERNRRDVPLINLWHPWVRPVSEGGRGLILTDRDGARFDFLCDCGGQVNTLEMWQHAATHHHPVNRDELILPDGL